MSMWPVTSCSEVLIWNYIERCKKHSVSVEIRIKTEKMGCFYEPRQAQRMRVLCGKGAGAAHTPVLWEVGRKCCRACDMERQWKLSELCLLSPACELQHVLLPCLLKPQVPRACTGLCQGSVPDRGLRPGAMPLQEQSIPTALPAVTSHLFPSPCPTVARERWRFLSECFPSWALPFCLLHVYLSPLFPRVASLSFLVLLCNAWGWSHK